MQCIFKINDNSRYIHIPQLSQLPIYKKMFYSLLVSVLNVGKHVIRMKNEWYKTWGPVFSANSRWYGIGCRAAFFIFLFQIL